MQGKFDANKMAETKKIIATGIADYFDDFRKKKMELMKDKKKVMKILEEGKAKAQPIAQKTLKEVKEIIGLI